MSLEAEPNSGLPSSAFEDVIIDKLMGVAFHLVDLGVGLVGCQKCVHPQIKDYLREKVSENNFGISNYGVLCMYVILDTAFLQYNLLMFILILSCRECVYWSVSPPFTLVHCSP